MKASPILLAAGAFEAVIFLILIGGGIWYAVTYNSLVTERENVDGSWAQVENQYQRKMDLIPQLVDTAETYMSFEQSTLTNITQLRSQWMEAESIEEKENLSNAYDAEASKIIITVENYPNIESIDAVMNLMYSIEGTENRIATERMRYNDAVKEYNAHIKKFPANIVASWSGFEERSYFESDAAP